MKKIKKILGIMLALMMLLINTTTTFAADDSREYFFELSVDGSDTKQVQTGDIITVVFNLKRTDSDKSYQMYGMQNEIRYDSEFFELVENSALLSDGIHTTDLGLRDNYREFYMNYVSFSGGEEWNAERLVGSFQLKVIATSGVTKITNQDYSVSTSDGMEHYAATCQDVTIILTTDCTVNFESNGGSAVESQTVQYGEVIERPDDPVREGYELAGWYSDLDLQNEWDFENDKVEGNMTLYAKWQKEGTAPIVEPEESADAKNGFSMLWLLLLLLLALLLLLFLLFGRKIVKFETGTETEIKNQKVRKGGYAERPEEPKYPEKTFAGWYSDEEYTKCWDFENDKVEGNMTLYAKWI